jgi:hypothetical protein
MDMGRCTYLVFWSVDYMDAAFGLTNGRGCAYKGRPFLLPPTFLLSSLHNWINYQDMVSASAPMDLRFPLPNRAAIVVSLRGCYLLKKQPCKAVMSSLSTIELSLKIRNGR